jgi:hypothetical protein
MGRSRPNDGLAHARPYPGARLSLRRPLALSTGEIRNQIDSIWNDFWSGGVSNPLSVIEQITYLLFVKRLDDLQTLEERKAQQLKQPIARADPNRDAQEELKAEVAGLPSGLKDDDIDAGRFDLLILHTQLALLRHEKRFEGLRKRIIETLALLEELDNISMVAAEMELFGRRWAFGDNDVAEIVSILDEIKKRAA